MGRRRADFDNDDAAKAADAPSMTKILRPILNAAGAVRDIVDEICHLDGQVRRILVAARRISRLQRLVVMEIRPLVRPVRIVAIPAFSNSAYNLRLDVGTISVGWPFVLICAYYNEAGQQILYQ